MSVDNAIEHKAKERFEADTLQNTGHKWDWNAASEEVKNNYRKMVKRDMR